MPNILLSGLNYGPKFNSIEHKKKKKNFKKKSRWSQIFCGRKFSFGPNKVLFALWRAMTWLTKLCGSFNPKANKLLAGLEQILPHKKALLRAIPIKGIVCFRLQFLRLAPTT